MNSPSTVVNELLEAHKKLEDAYEHIKKAMAYADDDTCREIERIRKKIIDAKLQIDYVIDRYVR
jgi:hypothetical protein